MTDQDIKDLMHSLQNSHLDEPVELIETHISWVILHGDRVWKIKKPMQYAFLDFSTLEARKEFCFREVELNRRLAPEMYLGVVEILRLKGEWTIGKAAGEVAAEEYAVEMLRMKEEMRLDRMMEAGKIVSGEGIKLGKAVAGFHQTAKTIFNRERCSVEGYHADFSDIIHVRADFVTHLGEEAGKKLDGVVADSMDWLSGQEGLLQERLAGGWIRDGHGDLHTRNIFVEETAQGTGFVIFDCIEFNDAFREIDVLSEIAFLYMDAEVRGQLAFGEAFMKGYLAKIDAMDGSADRELFNYFRRYRANVRAKVNALRARQAKGEELSSSVKEMQTYLDLMQRTRIRTSI
jgi:hypothetical protein